MNRNLHVKSVLILVLFLLCSTLFLPSTIHAASADSETTAEEDKTEDTTEHKAEDTTEYKAIEFTAEEQAYLERAGEITIGCPGQNCPLLFRNKETGQLEGITIDILDMISESTGLTFCYQELPSGNVTYQDLKRLQVDMVAGVESNAMNRESLGIAMTNPYLHAEKVFVCKKEVMFQPDGEMKVAVATGSQTLEKVILQQYPKFQILHCDSTEKALSALLSGKADAVLQNQYTMERILAKPIYEDLQIVAAASIGDSQCLASVVPIDENRQNTISDDTRILLSILNKGIASLDQDQVSFHIIQETVQHAYQFTVWDILYRYRFALTFTLICLLLIFILLRRNHILKQKQEEQLAAERRAEELAVLNERMKEQQLLLMDSLKHAEEGNRSKTFFLFNMSHDVRTPMNAILGYAEIARRNLDNAEKLEDCLGKIQVSGKQLLHLIDNVLDMTRIENGEVILKEECCNLEECLDKAYGTLQTRIESKKLTLHIDMSGVKNKWVYCDGIRINQILSHLLSNAIKFSKQGGSIWISMSQDACAMREYANYEIRVKDNGIGMTPEFLTRIFEPFEREHTSTVSQTQGVGLGLSIVKTIIDLMGGTIQVFSEPDQGTEFVLKFTFKLEVEEQSEPESAADSVSSYDFSGKRLLLVEDNELNMEIAEEILQEVGFEVETASDGQAAVEMVRNSAAGYYDAILMDIQMPVMDGYQASQEIRSMEDKALAEIPIIALTANTFDEDKKAALSKGMNAYVAKPIDVRELYRTLRRILK